jgi:uncharacterized membrane protein (UPF0182 family)
MSVRTRRGLLGLLAGGALALLAGRWLAGHYADFAFHHALGVTELWETRTLLTLGLAAGAFLWVTGFAFANLFAVRQSIVSLVLPRQLGGLEIAEAVPTRRLTVLAAALALAVGAIFALLPHDWAAAALALDPVPFGEFDPYLERDLGFFVAWLPWERALQERILAVVIAVGTMVVLGYAATPSIRWSETGLYVSTWVRRHFSVLAGLLVLLVGWDWRLDRYERLSAGSGVWMNADTASVFSAFDHRVVLPYLAAASFAAVPIAAVLTWAGWRGYLRLALTMLSAMIVGGPVAMVALPLAARGPLSTPEARVRERPYLSVWALYTRRAFGVDAIGGADTLSLARVDASALPRAISGWDPAALGPHGLGGTRSPEVAGLAWRSGPSGLEAVVLQRPSAATPASVQWTATTFAASRADDAGLPFIVGGLADARLDGVLVATGAGTYALVPDTTGHVAAPEFSSTLARVALSWNLQDPRLLLREPPSPRPRLVTARDVRDRVRRLVPFLTAGSTVTPLVRGDSLYWAVELFVTADRYPLSVPQTVEGREVHYARHAATAVVQAQTGVVQLIATERPDPVMRHWMRRFPSTFTLLAAAPDWVRWERPPAIDEMLIQGNALATVGFQGDSIGRRRLTRADDADADVADGPATLFQLDTTGALGWALPVDVPWAGTTLGVLVARGGELRRTEFHRAPGPRWTSILDELQARADAAGFGRSLPGSRRGRVQAVPTDAGPAWVQSHYVWPEDGLPRLAGVVVMLGGRTRTGRTLPEALGLRGPGPSGGADAFRERVARLYETMEAALRAGDWRAYGDAWAALGRLLERR